MAEADQVNGRWIVLVNHEQQYCIWPCDMKVPGGWRTVMEGLKSECLEYIENTWTDMRPLSLQKKMSSERMM